MKVTQKMLSISENLHTGAHFADGFSILSNF